MSTAVLGIRVVLAGVFALAGLAKLRDLEGSRRALREFGVATRPAAVIGVLLPLAEVATAIALIPAPTARWGAVAALILLLAFMGGIARALRRGEAPDCHCFGQIHSAPAGRETLVRNGVLAAAAGVVIVAGPGAAIDTWVADRSPAELVAVVAGACALAFGFLYIRLWRDVRHIRMDLGVAQRIAATAPPGIPLGSPAPEFSLQTIEGTTVTLTSLREGGRPVLLVFVSPGCSSCTEILPKLAHWQETLSQRLSIALISAGSIEHNQPLVDEYGLRHFLLQEHLEMTEAYRIRGTPSAVIVTADGKIGSNPAESVFGMEPLVRLALRDGTGTRVEGSVA